MFCFIINISSSTIPHPTPPQYHSLRDTLHPYELNHKDGYMVLRDIRLGLN